MSVISLLFITSTPLIKKRYSGKGRYYAWLIILLGFIFPFRPQWGKALINLEVPSGIFPSNTLPVNTLPLLESTVATEAAMTVSIWSIGFFVWLTGLITFLVHHGIKHYRFVKIARRWSVSITDDNILSTLNAVKSEIGIKRHIPLYLCEFSGSPIMLGLLKPRVLLPTINLTQDELYYILKHELIHYKRKDLLYKYLILAVTALHWFNPIVYIVVKHVHSLCETSCDTEVLQNTDSEMRKAYCEAMVGMIQYQSNKKTALSACFHGNKSNIKKRILSAMDNGGKRKGPEVVVIAFLLTLLTGLVFTINTRCLDNSADDNNADVNNTIEYVTVLIHSSEGVGVISLENTKTSQTRVLSIDEIQTLNAVLESTELSALESYNGLWGTYSFSLHIFNDY
jgi:beta-lactamase regulating signal transducer with metallopeptidase domain